MGRLWSVVNSSKKKNDIKLKSTTVFLGWQDGASTWRRPVPIYDSAKSSLVCCDMTSQMGVHHLGRCKHQHHSDEGMRLRNRASLIAIKFSNWKRLWQSWWVQMYPVKHACLARFLLESSRVLLINALTAVLAPLLFLLETSVGNHWKRGIEER